MQVKDVDTSQHLPVMEYFYTIQGEGSYSGRAAFFIRLAGCDVGCVWCDVKESWDMSEHPLQTIDFLLNEVVTSGTDFVVITGGEPAMYDLTTLVNRLKEQNIEVAIETSGTYPLLGSIDWYCFSPKKFKAPVDEAYSKASELKIIINHPSDFAWAEQHASHVSSNCKLYLQPEWSKQERFLPEIIAYVKNHPKWRISLQTHKFMNIP
jgi:7-carboxy-7-deazaguanine synthase